MNDAGFKVNESTVLPVEHNKFFAVFLVRIFVDFRLREGTHIARVPLTSCKPEEKTCHGSLGQHFTFSIAKRTFFDVEGNRATVHDNIGEFSCNFHGALPLVV